MWGQRCKRLHRQVVVPLQKVLMRNPSKAEHGYDALHRSLVPTAEIWKDSVLLMD